MERMEVFRVVESGLGTLHEVETTWSLVDIWDANQFLDVKDDIVIYSTPKPKKP